MTAAQISLANAHGGNPQTILNWIQLLNPSSFSQTTPSPSSSVHPVPFTSPSTPSSFIPSLPPQTTPSPHVSPFTPSSLSDSLSPGNSTLPSLSTGSIQTKLHSPPQTPYTTQQLQAMEEGSMEDFPVLPAQVLKTGQMRQNCTGQIRNYTSKCVKIV